MSDYIESLFQGVEILIDKKLESLAFDTTIICRIVDDSESHNGKYRVSDGSVIYVAYSEETDYKSGQSVRVAIPNNDYTQRKFILGKYGEEDNGIPITYVSSADSVVDISGDLIDADPKKQYGIVMNGLYSKKIIWNKSFIAGELQYLQNSGIYNTLILKANFQTLMSNYKVLDGEYGLRVELLIKPSEASQVRIRKSMELSSKEMFGDPYNFLMSTPQSKTFSLATVEGIIEGIEISLFQNDDFVTPQGRIEYDNDINPMPQIDHILVSGVEIAFGSDITGIADNVVQIYSPDSDGYRYEDPSLYTNQKRFGLVWYNKNEYDKYLGFSDGYFDETYDEITYLNESKEDSRLSAQVGKEGIPDDRQGLQLSLDLEDLTVAVDSVATLFNQEMATQLRNFKDGIKLAFAPDNENYKTLSGFIDGDSSSNIATKMEEIKTLLNTLKEFYYTRLKEICNNKTANSGFVISEDESLHNIYSQIKNYLNLIIEIDDKTNQLIGGNFYQLKHEINTNYPSYVGVVDIYEVRIKKVYHKIQSILDTISGFDETKDKLQAYLQYTTEPDAYSTKDFSRYNNKYCVYWYKYDKNYEATDDFQFLEGHWRKLDHDNFGIPKRKGSNYPMNEVVIDPDPMLVPGTENEYVMEDLYIEEYLDPEEKQQSFKAVLFYNHEMYVSNELVFTNKDEIPNSVILDTLDGLTIEHLDNSLSSYFVYGESNYLNDMADERKHRQLRCHLDGIKATDDEVLPGASVYWYIPESSMITYDLQNLISRGFVSDAGATEKPSYSRNGYTCFYKKIQNKQVDGAYDYKDDQGQDTRDFWYKIKSYYEPSVVQNYIICNVVPEGKEDGYETKVYFNFGLRGTSGTKYTLAILGRAGKSAIENNENLSLEASLRDANNDRMEITGNLSASFILNNKNLTAATSAAQITIIPSEISSCGILNVKLNAFELEDGRKVTLSQSHAIPWSNGNYYMSGTTRVIYNSLGSLDKGSAFNLPYRLFEEGTDIEISSDRDSNEKHVEWSIEYVDGQGAPLSGSDLIYQKFLPTIQNESYKDPETGNDIVSENRLLVPAPLYFEGIGTKAFAIVIATLKTPDGTNADGTQKFKSEIVWKQPLIIMQNRYESPMLNEWNGNFEIDEKNGTILSTMLGAGKKNDNNTFDGVLMGNVISISENNHTGMGIYGFNNGAQSFGFNIDGTAFLGKAGSGRIWFNGDGGSIYSGNYWNWKQSSDKDNLDKAAGMNIDLDDGFLEIYGKSGTGQIVMKTDPACFKMTAYSDALTVGGKTREAGQQTLINIDVDKNQYILQSYNYLKDKQGTSINLETGAIDSYNFYLNSNNIIIDSRERSYGDTSPYFKITGKYPDENGTTLSYVLMEVGLENYYLQSWHYADSEKRKKDIAAEESANKENPNYEIFTGVFDIGGKTYYKGMQINLVTGQLYSCQVDNVIASTNLLVNGLSKVIVGLKDEDAKNFFTNIAVRIFGRSGLLIDQTAEGTNPVLAAGNFSVGANGAVVCQGDWLLGIEGIGALTKYGISPISGLQNILFDGVDKKWVQDVINFVGDLLAKITSISWKDIYLTVLRAKVECAANAGSAWYDYLFGGIPDKIAQDAIDLLFGALYL